MLFFGCQGLEDLKNRFSNKVIPQLQNTSMGIGEDWDGSGR